MQFNDGATIEIVVFDGTRLDVFNAMKNFVSTKGFPLMTKDLVLRKPEDIQTRHDINKGDFILFHSQEYAEIFCIGFNMKEREALERVVYAVGELEGMKNDDTAGLDLYNLEDDTAREIYEGLIADIDNDFEEMKANFQDVLLIEAEPEQMMSVISSFQQQVDVPKLDLYNVQGDPNEMLPIDTLTIDGIEPGTILIGQGQREDGTPQVAVVGYGIKDVELSECLAGALDSMNRLNFKEHPPKIIRMPFEESRINTI